MDHERAAAALRLRDDDLKTFGGENARGGGVDVREVGVLHAAGEHADAAARSVAEATVRGSEWKG